jgi:hypothetical protein
MHHNPNKAVLAASACALGGALGCAAASLTRPRLHTLCSVSCAGREITTIYSARRKVRPRLLLAAAGCLTVAVSGFVLAAQ